MPRFTVVITRCGRSAQEASLIVCHCQGVSDRAIREAVRRGARSVGQVGRACRAGRNCGGCHPLIAEIIVSETGPPPGPAQAFPRAEGLVGAG